METHPQKVSVEDGKCDLCCVALARYAPEIVIGIMTKCAPKQKRVFIIFPKKMKTHSSHCSDHSAWAPDFSLTDVWNFSFPKLIVTNASFVPGNALNWSTFKGQNHGRYDF